MAVRTLRSTRGSAAETITTAQKCWKNARLRNVIVADARRFDYDTDDPCQACQSRNHDSSV